MPLKRSRVFSREFKLAAVTRMEAGENVSRLARELVVRRKLLYEWQERFHSVPMDEAWTMAAARYVELNPVRAGLARWPEDWPWSSAAGHLDGRGDKLAVASPLPRRAGDWRTFLDAGMADGELAAIREREATGRPLGAPAFIARLEELAGRPLAPRKRGRKPAAEKG